MSRNLSIAIIVSVAVLAFAYSQGVFAWVLYIGILVTSIVFVIRPILAEAESASGEAASDRSKRLFREKAQVLRMLKDLEFEKEVGTVDDDEFDFLWRRYTTTAARLNREIDAVDAAVEGSK